jgi:ABC-type protease/lipase transport system fused ATPase/permease subunit
MRISPFQFTAADNIAMGRIEAREDQAHIVAAAERALADEVIRKLPNTYNSDSRQALSNRHRSLGRRVAENRDRARLHARRTAADPGRADGGT